MIGWFETAKHRPQCTVYASEFNVTQLTWELPLFLQLRFEVMQMDDECGIVKLFWQ